MFYNNSIPGLRKDAQPWYHSWKNAYRRCTDPKNNRFQYYGAKGIRFELPFWDTGWLYVRDKAFDMKKPQIHRKKPTGNYDLENCCFIERLEHCSITHKGSKRSKESCRRMSKAGGTRWGEQHGKAKLTDREVERIRILLVLGRSGVSLAKDYGVSTSLISAIKHKVRRGRANRSY